MISDKRSAIATHRAIQALIPVGVFLAAAIGSLVLSILALGVVAVLCLFLVGLAGGGRFAAGALLAIVLTSALIAFIRGGGMNRWSGCGAFVGALLAAAYAFYVLLFWEGD